MSDDFLMDISKAYTCDFCYGQQEEKQDCSGTLKYQVCKSAYGYYIGWFCDVCGPYSRESGYYGDKAEAEEILKARLSWVTEG